MVREGSETGRNCDAQLRALPSRRREHGATTVIVVIGMVAMMGAAAFAIDLGAAWALRRDLITGTDAAALATVADYANPALGLPGCAGTDDTYLGYNAPNATLVSCSYTATGGGFGYVEVEATQQTPAYFGRVLGQADFDVPSYSAAALGQISAASGLRPFGLCAGTISGGGVEPAWLTQLKQFLVDGQTTTIRISYGKDAQTDPCNDPNPSAGAGNWGTLDLDDPLVCAPAWDPTHPCNGNPNPNPDLAYWTRNGYERPIEKGLSPGYTCVSDAEHCWDGDSGADMNGSQVKTALNSLITNETWFVLPLFDYSQGTGPSGNGRTNFHVFEFARVQVKAYCFATCGTNSTPLPPCGGAQCGWYIDLKFEAGLVGGICCDHSATVLTAAVPYLCAVDPTATSGC